MSRRSMVISAGKRYLVIDPPKLMMRTPARRAACVGSNVWVESAQMAREYGAVDLGFGFSDSSIPWPLARSLRIVADHPEVTEYHQYTRGHGHPRLVSALSSLYSQLYGVPLDWERQILVTAGACHALFQSFQAWINEGDEVILLEPAFDNFRPQIEMAGGTPVAVVMPLKEGATSSADYHVDLEAIENAITPKTKMLVLNNPHNPSGKLFTRLELEGIARIAEKHDLIVVADEVYEWHTYEGTEMIRFASLPGMFRRTISIGSAGKAFSATGWKLGWAVAPVELMEPIKAIHDNCVFTCSTPTQESVASMIEHELKIMKERPTESFLKTELTSGLRAKRDRVVAAVQSAGMRPIIPEAGYFLMASFEGTDLPFANDASTEELDVRFSRWLCRERNLASIPVSVFFSDQFKKNNQNMIRFCFAKQEETLSGAESALRNFSHVSIEQEKPLVALSGAR